MGAGGEIHRHLGYPILPQEDEGVAKHARNLSTYYILQEFKNQSIPLTNLIKTQVCQTTNAALSQPQNVPRFITARKTLRASKRISSNGMTIMRIQPPCQDASSGRHTCLPYAS